MITELTLKLDKDLLAKARVYAKINGISLNKLVEDHFKSLIDQAKTKDPDSTPLVNELSGVLRLNPDFDLKKDRW
jgi:hypothetical protein